MSRSPIWVEQDYQFFKDDAVQGSATAYANENTAASIPIGTAFRLLTNAGDTNNATTGNSTAFKLQFRVNSGTWTDVGSATAVRYATSGYVSDGNNYTTQRLTSMTGSTYTSSYNEFDSNNSLTSRTWADTYAEYEFCLLLYAGSIAANDTVEFRVVTAAGGVFTTYSNVPTLTAQSNAKTGTASVSVTASGPTVVGKKGTSSGAISVTAVVTSLTVGISKGAPRAVTVTAVATSLTVNVRKGAQYPSTVSVTTSLTATGEKAEDWAKQGTATVTEAASLTTVGSKGAASAAALTAAASVNIVAAHAGKTTVSLAATTVLSVDGQRTYYVKRYPNVIISASHLSGAYTDIDEDPTNPDGSWLLFAA